MRDWTKRRRVGLVPLADVRRKEALVVQETPRTIKTHGQITRALKVQAKLLGKNTNDVYNQFFRESFLRELMKRGDGWVVKGGSGIYCRIPGARQTKDLDLYREKHPTSAVGAAEALVRDMEGHRAGPYTFRVQQRSRAKATGAVDSERVDVTVLYGMNNRLLSFGVDVSGDLEVTGAVESVTASATYELHTEFLPSTYRVYVYPVASQIADKVCALYERHGEIPPGRPSTRYHDLYDIALIARELPVNAADLGTALETQCRLRRMRLPDRIVAPDGSWEEEYPKKAAKFGDARWGLEDLDEALRVTGLLVDPVLGGEAGRYDQQWDYTVLRWRRQRR